MSTYVFLNHLTRPGQLIDLIDNRDYLEIIVMTIMLTIIVMSIIHIVYKEEGTRK